jgi:hypothetical protein
MTLFDLGKEEYRLFDEMRLRFIRNMAQKMDESEAEKANERFAKAKCGHLKWTKDKPRTYTVKR